MSTIQHRSDVISRTRQASTKLLHAIADLEACASAWNGRGIKAQVIDATGSDPTKEGYKANDFIGNEGIVKADINQVLGVALDNLRTFVNGTDGRRFEDISQ